MTPVVFLLVYCGGLLASLVRHPIFGLYAYVWAFYLAPQARWWSIYLPDLRWSLIAALVTFVSMIRLKKEPDNRPAWYTTPPAKFLIAYTGWMWIQTIWAIDLPSHIDESILFTKYVVLFYLIYRLTPDERTFTRFLWIHVLGCIYLGYLAWGMNVSGRLEGVGGPGLGEANTFGMHLSTGVAAAAALLLVSRSNWRWLLIPGLAFVLNGIVLTASRSAFLGFIAMGLGLYLLKPPAYRKVFYVFAILGAVLFVRLSDNLLWQRISTVGAAVERDKAEMDGSAHMRWVVGTAQLKMARDHPFGGGARTTAALSPLYLPPQDSIRASHNTYLAVLVDQGLPGVAIYAGICLWAFRTLLRMKGMDKAGLSVRLGFYRAALGGALLGLLVSGLFVNYLRSEVQVWLLALVAALWEISRVTMQEAVAKEGGRANGTTRVRGPPTRRPLREPRLGKERAANGAPHVR